MLDWNSCGEGCAFLETKLHLVVVRVRTVAQTHYAPAVFFHATRILASELQLNANGLDEFISGRETAQYPYADRMHTHGFHIWRINLVRAQRWNCNFGELPPGDRK